MRGNRFRFLVLALALLGLVLYACVLPLWEGFDEPFHYAYVQSLAVSHRFPAMRESRVSQEIWESLRIVPVSRFLAAAVPGGISFEDWSKLTAEQKRTRSRELASIDPSLRRVPSPLMNYEAQQAPLAYLALAPFDVLFSKVHLKTRILLLRVIGAAAAVLLLFAALEKLLQVTEVRGAFAAAALACVFESQMLWASVAHAGNDFLAVPLTACFLAWLAAAVRDPSTQNLLVLSIILTCGLLTKAYLLAFVPVFAALLIFLAIRRLASPRACSVAVLVLALAAPWYVRNISLYGTFSGTQESAAGISIANAVAALGRIDWSSNALNFARWSLWTGNWSFLSFSKLVLNAELILLAAAFICFLLQLRRKSTPQIWILIACACFAFSLLYQTGATWVYSHGASNSPEPWYAQGVIVCLWILCFRGLQHAGRFGRALATGLLALSTWIALMTYWAKLLPYYGGGITRSTASAVWAWWRVHPSSDLSTVVMAPVPLIYLLLVVFSAALVALAITIAIGVWTATPQYSPAASPHSRPELPPLRLP